MTIDDDKLADFLARFGADQAAATHAATVLLGHRLGLYKALATGGPQTSDELAASAGCHPRLVKEWLHAQAASEYCQYEPVTGRFSLTPEQAACLADEDSPTFVAGGLAAANAIHRTEERVRQAFVGDGAIAWHEHPEEMFAGGERAFRGAYQANLVDSWIPALDGIEERLRAGGRVADVGCGFGTPLILLAEAFPASTFAGFDTHDLSIEQARKAAAEAGVSDRVTFEVASATDFPGRGYDLVCLFNALHEMGDPVAAARHVHDTLDDNGALMLVEPLAADRLEEGITPLARSFYSVSTFVCVPNALSQGATSPLGAQTPDATFGEVVRAAGFTRFRRATETPLHRVLEARP